MGKWSRKGEGLEGRGGGEWRRGEVAAGSGRRDAGGGS